MKLPGILLTVLLSLFARTVLAEMVMIEATQDNTLYESAQGSLSNGAGEFLFVGRTNNGEIRRALMAFKDLSAIPAGATITSVKLHLHLSKERSGSTNLNVTRVLEDWGEGTSQAGGEEGAGGPAATGDATWLHTFFSSQTWQTPGGDFFDTPSAGSTIDAAGPYVIDSTAELISDVQDWLENPEDNFGWALTAGETSNTSKRFSSRTNSFMPNRPMLEVEFDAPAQDFSGPWFDPARDGEGYLVYKTEAGWIIYFFGYSAEGNPLWLLSDIVQVGTPVFGQDYTFKMVVGEGGDFNNPVNPAELEEWGTLTVNFTDCTNGVFVLDSTTELKTSNAIKIIGIEGTQCGSPD